MATESDEPVMLTLKGVVVSQLEGYSDYTHTVFVDSKTPILFIPRQAFVNQPVKFDSKSERARREQKDTLYTIGILPACTHWRNERLAGSNVEVLVERGSNIVKRVNRLSDIRNVHSDGDRIIVVISDSDLCGPTSLNSGARECRPVAGGRASSALLLGRAFRYLSCEGTLTH